MLQTLNKRRTVMAAWYLSTPRARKQPLLLKYWTRSDTTGSIQYLTACSRWSKTGYKKKIYKYIYIYIYAYICVCGTSKNQAQCLGTKPQIQGLQLGRGKDV